MTLRFDQSQRQLIAQVDGLKRGIRKEQKAARPKSPKADRGRVRDNGYLAFLRRQPCDAAIMGDCNGPIDPAHIRFNDGPERQNPGGARKNHDRHCNPLCRTHHDLQHSMSERRFWEIIRKDAYETAAAHYADYLAGATKRAARAIQGRAGHDA